MPRAQRRKGFREGSAEYTQPYPGQRDGAIQTWSLPSVPCEVSGTTGGVGPLSRSWRQTGRTGRAVQRSTNLRPPGELAHSQSPHSATMTLQRPSATTRPPISDHPHSSAGRATITDPRPARRRAVTPPRSPSGALRPPPGRRSPTIRAARRPGRRSPSRGPSVAEPSFRHDDCLAPLGHHPAAGLRPSRLLGWPGDDHHWRPRPSQSPRSATITVRRPSATTRPPISDRPGCSAGPATISEPRPVGRRAFIPSR